MAYFWTNSQTDAFSLLPQRAFSLFNESEKTIENFTMSFMLYDSDGNIVGEEAFDIEDESSGTIRYMVFIQHFLNIIYIHFYSIESQYNNTFW